MIIRIICFERELKQGQFHDYKYNYFVLVGFRAKDFDGCFYKLMANKPGLKKRLSRNVLRKIRECWDYSGGYAKTESMMHLVESCWYGWKQITNIYYTT